MNIHREGHCVMLDKPLCCHWNVLTICRRSEETICMQHIAVAKAHTMVEMILRAHTLNNRSCEETSSEYHLLSRGHKGQEVLEEFDNTHCQLLSINMVSNNWVEPVACNLFHAAIHKGSNYRNKHLPFPPFHNTFAIRYFLRNTDVQIF